MVTTNPRRNLNFGGAKEKREKKKKKGRKGGHGPCTCPHHIPCGYLPELRKTPVRAQCLGALRRTHAMAVAAMALWSSSSSSFSSSGRR